MSVSQKCQYALRAVFELAGRHGESPTSIREIARIQAIPPKFLELILAELRKGGFVESRRGVHGGYSLAASPKTVSAGEIIRFIDGPFEPVRCVGDRREGDCPLYAKCAFMDMWTRARDAVADVYDSTTFQDLIDAHLSAAGEYVACYCI
ncbi:MAG: Rrf2 family transcriptional regulator [Planctomycetota bacterium]|nr:Rrf2 family transcriptional regulator [Planctomycetota bacterium]